MTKIQLQPMDMFHTHNPSTLGGAINATQTFHSRDGKSVFSHSGYLTSSQGDTFEAVWRLKEQNLFDHYKGKRVLIVRWTGLPQYEIPGYLLDVFETVHAQMKKEHLGQIYPAWRLPFHLFPPMAKYVSYKGHWIVCSEVVSKMLYKYHQELRFRGLPCHDDQGVQWPRHHQFCGTNPDTLSDEGHRWDGFEVLHDKALDRKNFNLED